MNIVLLVYLASIVNAVKTTTGIVAVILTILFLAYGLFTSLYNSDQRHKEDCHKMQHTKKTLSVIIFLGSVSVFTPSEKTIYLMAGASIAQDIANSPKTAAAMEKVYKIVEKKLDNQLEELMDKAEKKIKSEEVAK
jgi:Ca2+/Na+ antiporter